jgi:hypothetical protein
MIGGGQRRIAGCGCAGAVGAANYHAAGNICRHAAGVDRAEASRKKEEESQGPGQGAAVGTTEAGE